MQLHAKGNQRARPCRSSSSQRDEAEKRMNSKVILMIDLTVDFTCDVEKVEAKEVEDVDY